MTLVFVYEETKGPKYAGLSIKVGGVTVVYLVVEVTGRVEERS